MDRTADNGSIVTWARGDQLIAQRLDASGQPRGAALTLATVPDLPQHRFALAALRAGGFVLAWTEDTVAITPAGVGQVVQVRRFDAQGTPLAETSQASTEPVHQAVGTLALRATPDGGYVVGWTGPPALGQPAAAWFQRFDASGLALGKNVAATGAGEASDLALAPQPDGQLLLAWVDSSLGPAPQAAAEVQAFGPQGTPLGPPQAIPASSGPAPLRLGASALAVGELALLWQREPTALPPQLTVQVVNALGQPVTAPADLATGPFVTQPRVIPLESGFAAAWQEEKDWNRGSSAAIWLQPFDAQGAPVGTPQQLVDRSTGQWSSVNPGGGNSGRGYAIAGGADGHLVLAYEGFDGGNTVFVLGR